MAAVPAEIHGPSDADLIESVRAGQREAYGSLYERHVSAAYNLARQLARSTAEADDLVSEAFARVLDTLRAGRGPDSAFRAYLLTALRHVAYDKTRRDRKVELTDDVTTVSGVSTEKISEPFRDTAMAGLERSLAAKAFARLPERWQAVLWHTEIEGQSPAEVAPLLGLTANGVSALAYRAREGLRQAYLQVHLAESTAGRCRATADKLGAWTRGGLSKRETAQVEAHLDECERCRALAAELADVNGGLRVVATLVLGVGTAGYLATTAKATTGITLAAAATTGASAGGVSGVVGALSSVPRQLVGVGASVAALAVFVGVAMASGTTQHIPTAAVPPSPPATTAPARSHGAVPPPGSAQPPSPPSPSSQSSPPSQSTQPPAAPPPATVPNTTPAPPPPGTSVPAPPPSTTTPVPPTTTTTTSPTTPPPPPGQPVLNASGPLGGVTITPGQGAVPLPITVGNTGTGPSTPITVTLHLPNGVVAGDGATAGPNNQPTTHSMDAHPIDFVPRLARTGSTTTVQCPGGTSTVTCTTPGGLAPGDTVIMLFSVTATPAATDGTITGTVSAGGTSVAIDVDVHVPQFDALTLTARIDVWDSWWNWLLDGSPVLDAVATNTGTSTKPITVTVTRPGTVWSADPGCVPDHRTAVPTTATCTSSTPIAPGKSLHVRFRLHDLEARPDTFTVTATLGEATVTQTVTFTPPECRWLWCWQPPSHGGPPPRGSSAPPTVAPTGGTTPPPAGGDHIRPRTPSPTTKQHPTPTLRPPTTPSTPPPTTTTTSPPTTTVPIPPPVEPPGCANQPGLPGRIQPGGVPCLPLVPELFSLLGPV